MPQRNGSWSVMISEKCLDFSKCFFAISEKESYLGPSVAQIKHHYGI